MRRLAQPDDAKHVFKRTLNLCTRTLFGVEVQLFKYSAPSNLVKKSIIGNFSSVRKKELIDMEYGIYDPVNAEFFLTHDTGLYSCMSAALWSICDLIAAGHLPSKVNFSGTLSAYKETAGEDTYPQMFESPSVSRLRDKLPAWTADRLKHFDHHGSYSALDFDVLSALVETYFKPNQQIHRQISDFSTQYLKNGQRYVGICIRGTDKATEIAPTDSSLYVERAQKLLEEGLADRVLIQTDQAQICDLFKHHFSGICDVIEALPRTSGQIVLHQTAEISGKRISFAQNMTAAMYILSSMSHIVTHTGNIGAWITLMRGTTRNVWQAGSRGITLQSLA